MPSPSWMLDRLNQATERHHGHADAAIDALFHADVNVDDYRDFLVSVYGFEAPLEAALSQTPQLDTFLNLRDRARAGFLAGDLMRLGLRPTALAELPMCLTVPQFRSAAEALGWMYLAERASLAHAVVSRHLVTRMPEEMAAASGYLSSAGGLLGTRWRQFGAAVDRVANHPAVAERVIAAALDAYRCLERWTAHELTPAKRAG